MLLFLKNQSQSFCDWKAFLGQLGMKHREFISRKPRMVLTPDCTKVLENELFSRGPAADVL